MVGEQTAGFAGNPLEVPLPGGVFAYIVTMESTYPDGRKFDGIGVVPDVEVTNSRHDAATGRDRVLEKGLEVLKAKIEASSAHNSND